MLYVVCMLGALVGFAAVLRVSAWRRPSRLAVCAGSAVALEVAWIVLTVGEFCRIEACTQAGMALIGLSTSVMLCLWLTVGQADDSRVEVSKLAVGLFSAFVLNAVLAVGPYLGWLSFTFPLLTGVPLWLRLRAGEGAAGDGAPAGQAVPTTWATLCDTLKGRMSVCPLLMTVGAGVGLLGFDGTMVDYAVILAALVLLVPAWLGMPVRRAVGKLTTPLVVIGLVLGYFAGSGAPFSVFLSGCAACLAWFWLDMREDGRHDSLRSVGIRQAAALLGTADVLAMAGLVAEQAAVGLGGLGVRDAMVLLCALVVAAELVWGLASLRKDAGMSAPDMPVWRAMPQTCSEGSLVAAFGLTPREAQVARLLCENRSVNYICSCLGLSRSTVKTHASHVYAKLGVHSRDELVALVEGEGSAR